MGNRLFVNNASALLGSNLSNIATTVALAAGFGQYFPNPSGTQFFIATIEDTSGNIEYVKCTARSTDNLTVVRAQEGTTALAFTANLARVECRMTAGQAAAFLQKDGDTLTGALDLGAQTLTNGVLSGTGITIEHAGEIVNTPIRGLTGATGNQITVPTDGTSRAQAGGVNIVIASDAANAFTVGQVMMFSGALANIPAGWALCDGGVHNLITVPDLRNAFIVGAGNTYTEASTGTISGTAAAASAGTPVVNPVTLATANLPVHAHPFDYFFANASAVIGVPSFASTGFYMFGGSGPGSRIAFAGTNAGSGTPFTPTCVAMDNHSHSVSIATGTYYALYYIMYVG